MTEPVDTRAEAAFRDAFAEHADRFEPTPLGPISARPRLRRWVGVVAAASVLAVLGGTAIGVVLSRDDAGEPGRDTDRATANEPPEGWRYQSTRDIQVEVPTAWGYAAAPKSDWCVGDTPYSSGPYVATSGRFEMVREILCPGDERDLLGGGVPERLWETHVSFADAGASNAVKDGTVSSGSWTRIARTVGAAQVRVLTDAEHLEEARRIVESAEVVDTDGNGCTATSRIQAKKYLRPPAAFDVADVADVDSISICQYGIGEGTAKPGLAASRQLTGADADAVLSAIKAAPVGGGPNSPDNCLHDLTPHLGLVLRLNTCDQARELYVYNASCINNGFDDGTNVRELTRDACVPLYGGRVTYPGGSGGPAGRCMPPR